jgi:hypothetical protein
MRRTHLKDQLEDLVDRTGRVEDMLEVLAGIYRERARTPDYRTDPELHDAMLATAHVLHEASEAVAAIFGEEDEEALEHDAERAAWQAAHEEGRGRENPAKALRKRDLLSLLAVPENRAAVEHFVRVMRAYQSDSAESKGELADAYLALPEPVKDAIGESKARLKKLYRGDDGKSRYRATSWTSSLNYAKSFGAYVLAYDALASHGGTINTHKLVKLLDFAFKNHGVGDDEDEVIILEPVWKSRDVEADYFLKRGRGYWFPRVS